MTYILGVSPLVGENPAAALIKDGKLIAMAEEERFNRIKHSEGFPFPERSISFCLNYAGITLKEVDRIGIGWSSPSEYLYKNLFLMSKRPILALNFQEVLRSYRLQKSHRFFTDRRITFYPHHLSHAASAFYVSGFSKANIISMDGRGETTSTLLGEVKNSRDIEVLKEYNLLSSIGSLYESVTDYLGFRKHSQEGKVMALASYGKPIYDNRAILRYTKEGYSCETLARYLQMLKFSFKKFRGEKINSFNELLIKNFGPKRNRDDPLTKRHENIAATMQHIQEKVVVKLGKYLYEKNGMQSFCLAGGSSLNCIANGVLLEQEFVKDIYIQPASSDAGTAIGAAFLEWAKLTGKPSTFKMTHGYWGPEYSNEEIEKELKNCGLKYKYYKDIEGVTAELLAKGKILGWFQGRMEIGPRALGNRSILADPTFKDMSDRVNIQVKHREPWRPFAPSLLDSACEEYLENPYPSPFMILSFRVKREKWNEIPSVVHIDGTTRPQTVTKEDNPRYYKLIKSFESIKGTPVLLNTSFNDRGEPIVCSPQDSLKTFKKTGLDYLSIGNFIVSK